MRSRLRSIPPRTRPKPTRFYVGLDLGQRQDYTAAAVLEVARRFSFSGGAQAKSPLHLRHVERLPLGTPYPEQVRRVAALMQSKPLRGQSALVVDATGVGQAVVDLFREADVSGRESAYDDGGPLVSVSITGGASVTRGDRTGAFRVPKRTLASTLQAELQAGRLKFAGGLEFAGVLRRELAGFRVKVSAQTGHESFEHRDGEHDDLVLALALAAWYARLAAPEDGAYRIVK